MRFSTQKRKWVVERKCDAKYLRKPVRYVKDGYGGERERILPEDSDVYIQYKDGYAELFCVHSPTLRIMEEIYRTDTSRAGKYYISKLTEEYEKKEREIEMKRREKSKIFPLRRTTMCTWPDPESYRP